MTRAIKKNVKTAQTKHEIEPVQKTDEVVLFQSKDGAVSLPVSVDGKTVWLTQSQMAQLFGKDRTVIARHIRNAISEGEIDVATMCAKFAYMGVDQDQVYKTEIYNLDVVISMGRLSRIILTGRSCRRS